MAIGNYLAQIRQERGLTQKELAEKCNVSPTEISRIESGKRMKPSPVILRDAAKALNIEYSDLMREAGYIEEQHDQDQIFELVFRDEETGEIVDVVRGVKEMFRKDETWANVAYRVSHELGDRDRRFLTDMAMAYLKTKREEKQGN